MSIYQIQSIITIGIFIKQFFDIYFFSSHCYTAIVEYYAGSEIIYTYGFIILSEILFHCIKIFLLIIEANQFQL